MTKKDILKKFEDGIASDLAVLTRAALAAHDAATHVESKAEDQYDTRGLEASYLAGAQSKRAMELEEMLALFKFVDVKVFDATTPIASTALIALHDEEGARHWYLMMPKGGGRSVKLEDRTIHCITPVSPLGEALLGRKVGDQIIIRLQGREREYDVAALE